jgi:hypothetical protein
VQGPGGPGATMERAPGGRRLLLPLWPTDDRPSKREPAAQKPDIAPKESTMPVRRNIQPGPGSSVAQLQLERPWDWESGDTGKTSLKTPSCKLCEMKCEVEGQRR